MKYRIFTMRSIARLIKKSHRRKIYIYSEVHFVKNKIMDYMMESRMNTMGLLQGKFTAGRRHGLYPTVGMDKPERVQIGEDLNQMVSRRFNRSATVSIKSSVDRYWDGLGSMSETRSLVTIPSSMHSMTACSIVCANRTTSGV